MTVGVIARAGFLERWAARAWNVLNEGRGFLPCFCLGTLAAWRLLRGEALATGPAAVALALLAALPAAVALGRWDYPLRLRAWLWPPLAAFAATGLAAPPLGLWTLQLALYAVFTVGVWGTLYYHLRIGTPLDNWRRFWRMVLETSDTTSGNAREQVPKFLLLGWIVTAALPDAASGGAAGAGRLAAVAAFGAGLHVYGWLVHRLGLRWLPEEPSVRAYPPTRPGTSPCRRALVVVVDGCRADLVESDAPFLRAWLERSVRYTRMETVYPARTVACFTSMLTGTYPRHHGVTSNLVWRRGLACDTLFAALEREGRRGRLLAVSHLEDVFPHHCLPFTAVARNEEVDAAILARARRVLEEEDPDLLVVQLIAVDQTGHSRGVLGAEQRERMRATDRELAAFWRWLEQTGRLRDTAVVICADHGQSRGIGSHGHLDDGERIVPFGVFVPGASPARIDEPQTIASLAPTLAVLLGVPAPRDARAPVLPGPWLGDEADGVPQGDVWAVMPAFDEEASVAEVVARVPRTVEGRRCRVLVVDDGSRDATAERALAAGADLVVRHERNRGLGAAVRTGLETALRMGAAAAVILDADGEYDPEAVPDVLRPVLSGRADYVLGSRFPHGYRVMTPSRRWGNVLFTALQVLLTGRPIADGQTGMRAFSRAALGAAEIVHDYNYAQVLTIDLLRKGCRLAQVPVPYRLRRTGTSFVRFPSYPLRVLPAMLVAWLRPLDRTAARYGPAAFQVSRKF